MHLLLWLLLLQISLSSSSHYIPPDNYLIDCGSPSDSTVDGRSFFADPHRTTVTVRPPSSKIFARNQRPSSDLPQIYHTARIFTYPSSYAFEIRRKGTHMVRLHFFPFEGDYNLSSAVFSVHALGFSLLNEFSVAARSLVVKEYLVDVKSDRLVLCFVPSMGSYLAFVNAIEVVSMPDSLVPEIVHMDGRLNYDNFLSNQALEIVHRINMGGPKITPLNDSLCRTWIPDDGYLKTVSSAESKYFGGPIVYHMTLSNEIAPGRVYRSAQVLRANEGSNITWVFPVDLGYKYFVRFHFCDIVSLALNQLHFNVYINGWCAYKELDLSNVTNGFLAYPFYSDFIVEPNARKELRISVGALDGNMVEKNALLNGLEIWKLNNSMASLDGEPSSSFTAMDGSGMKMGAAIEFFGAIVLIMLAIFPLVVILVKRMKARRQIGWTRLAIDGEKV
ncbi:receptor-like protein kinase HERK 1 [Nymphaea colorata]|uniref:receptor-like protein kinase HERK 1 n=1 Tax=Nymphaea colorata TaxID=210225 RepID=UPI00214EA114|nr:receptor-like protein kinase HERK 1 [Nymphaea colorata]